MNNFFYGEISNTVIYLGGFCVNILINDRDSRVQNLYQ